MIKKKIIITALFLTALSGFSFLVKPSISFANRFDDLLRDFNEGRLSTEDYNRLYKEEERLQRIENEIRISETQINLRRNLLQDPTLTPERKKEIEAEIARFEAEIIAKRQELKPAGIKQDADRKVSTKTEIESCSRLKFDIPCWIRSGISFIGGFFKHIFGVVLWLVGSLFDASVSYSILDFKNVASESITVAWTVLRDLANVFFIFILLYIAIGMILQLQNINGRRMLVSVIIVALLINFSAFFTRIVIDASNVVAAQFYNAISKKDTATVFGTNIAIGGISASFMNALPLGTAIAAEGGTGQFFSRLGTAFVNSTAASFGVVIMMLVTIFVFLVATILFAIRTVTLIFLIILSPLAFLMYAFPNQEGLFKKWWSTLFNQAFFAPLYLIMVYVTLLFLKSGVLSKISAQSASGVEITLHFMIAIGFMFGAIIIAKSLGAKGAAAAMKGAGALTGAAAGAVGWGTKKGLSAAWKSRTAEGREQMAAARKEFYGKVGTTFKDFKAAPFKTTTKGITKGVELAEKKLPLGKQVGEFIRRPLKTTAEGLAAVTKDYGVSGVLGRTKDEEAEKRKKDKEEKELAREKELREYAEKLESIVLTKEEAAKILEKMKPKEIAKLSKKALKNPIVIHNLNPEDLKAMNREGVDREVMKEIYANIVGREGKGREGDKDYIKPIEPDQNHPAYKYVSANPFGRRGGIAVPPPIPPNINPESAANIYNTGDSD
ncbi:MAG: hypothetical protein AAB677_00255 [Patescibacteria group bacterium]